MKRRLLRSALRILLATILVLGIAVLGIWILIAQPSFRSNTRSQVTVRPEVLEEHVLALSRDFLPRNHLEAGNLEKTAAYIEARFRSAGAAISSQKWTLGNRSYRNVIGTFGTGLGGELIVGAHYDACGETPGADDNASGVAVLIELAALLGAHPPDREIELVGYTLEEPPFFGTPRMGSYRHAEALATSGDEVAGVIVLEMVGYFTSAVGSQEYPNRGLSVLYPNRGDFIAVVGNLDQRPFTRGVKAAMQGSTALPVYSINGPASLPGLDFSDHRNYWPHGINAVMITDTAFYRNKEYHGAGDTADRLDYEAMARVAVSVYEAVKLVGR